MMPIQISLNRLRGCIAALLLMAMVLLCGTVSAEEAAAVREPLDYSDAANWAYAGEESGETAADVFFLAPSAFGGKEGAYLMDLQNAKGRANFVGVINMEKGIYDDETRFYAPFYRQVGYRVYGNELPEGQVKQLKDFAYGDVKDAFTYYLEQLNHGRPFILAGFSQGAELAIRLMKDCLGEEAVRSRLIACYAIGWTLTQEETEKWPQLRAAQGETDTGVIVSFNSEAEEVRDSSIVPAGEKTLAINPLNWRTDGELAGKERNLGACFTDYEGTILEEIPELTGAWLDGERGTLKVTDIDPAIYSNTLPNLAPGVYHLYDYQFFYRNLEKNVADRIRAYVETHFTGMP